LNLFWLKTNFSKSFLGIYMKENRKKFPYKNNNVKDSNI